MRNLSLFILLIIGFQAEAQNVPKARLSTGKEMPVIGLGTWLTEGPEVVESVSNALDAGYRHIDTAWLYRNEAEVGKGLKKAIDKGTVKREDVFITTKVWPQGMNRRKSLDVIKNSLKLLNTSYVDLVLVHHPLGHIRATAEVYKGLEDAYNQGLTRSIGVSNFKPKEIEDLKKLVSVRPAVNQIRIHPGFNQQQSVDYCQKNNITVTGYSPLSTGNILSDPTLINIGKKHKKSAAQVAIRWQIQRGLVVIPKSVKKNRIVENFDVFDFKLTNEDMTKINSMPQQNIRDFWG